MLQLCMGYESLFVIHNQGLMHLTTCCNQKDGRGQRFGSSSSFGSVDGSVSAAVPVVKREDSTSLIDFSVEPDPPAARVQPDPFGLTVAVQPSADALNSTGWATFGSAAPAPFAESLTQAPTGASAPVLSTPGVSGGFTSPSNMINGNSQWAAEWTASSVPQAVDPSATSWSSLVGPSVPPTSSQVKAYCLMHRVTPYLRYMF